MARPVKFEEKRRILKHIYQHYTDLKDYCSTTGQYFINHGPVTISILDLEEGLDRLPPKRKQAFYLHVIKDMAQHEAGEIMGIHGVTVGQYANEALDSLTEHYFASDAIEEWSGKTTEEVTESYNKRHRYVDTCNDEDTYDE